MPHIIILTDEFGNQIGEYYPPHDPEGGGRSEVPRVEFNNAEAAVSIHAALKGKEPQSIEVTFKGKH